MKKLLTLYTTILVIMNFESQAQDINVISDTSVQIKGEKTINPDRNFIKINITAIVFKKLFISVRKNNKQKIFSCAFIQSNAGS